jgi:A/G-specific adenine glycosylase
MSPREFKKIIVNYYKENKRSFAWRETKDHYKILVSEIMLQQTQTERVKIKYAEWMEQFPTLESLAQAPLQKVLKHWHGLGYNSRALRLKRLAEVVVEKYNGKIPNTYDKILELPGIGPYTAGAVLAFAFNKAVPIIETNIRTVYIHHFFPKDHGQIHDKEILELVAKTLPKEKDKEKLEIRDWYYALMDYGVHLKKTVGNLNQKSKHYTKQSTFKGSNRELRAGILRAITEKPQTEKEILHCLKDQKIQAESSKIDQIIMKLTDEGFI